MFLRRLWLTDYRSHRLVDLTLGEGVTVIQGPNGAGKTNLAEAICFSATLSSFRGSPTDALIRVGADAAVVRAETVREGREHLIEIEVPRHGRTRAQLDRNRVARRSDLAEGLVASVFAPDDLELVKGGPNERRDLLDETLTDLSVRHAAVVIEVDRILRQRNALLRGVGGRLDDGSAATLDVWDLRLAESGSRLSWLRSRLVQEVLPVVTDAYGQLTGGVGVVELQMSSSWSGELTDALLSARTDDVRRGTSTVGPHRDDLMVTLNGMPARTHASQGEQRSVALALRLGAHALLSDRLGASPVLVLDDVFSELDAGRSAALLGALPPGQVLITSAAGVPAGSRPDQVLSIDEIVGCQ